jgi:hypothetical protein
MSERIQQSAKIDFGSGQSSGLEELSGSPKAMINLIRQGKAGEAWIRLMPGSSTWNYAPTVWPSTTAVIGMLDFDDKLIYVTEDRNFYSVEAPGLVILRSDPTDISTQLQGAERPSFASAKTQIFAAGGGAISYWDGITPFFAQIPLPAPYASFVSANSQRIIATPFDKSGQIQWTDPLETVHITGWNPINFAEAEARPDKAVAVFENSNYLYVFGTETVQAFSPDANVAYSPVATTNLGTNAPHSIINLLEEKLFAWFAHNKEFMISDGHTQPKSISGDMTEVFQTMAVWNDCRGFRIRIAGADLLIWFFPSAGRTFFYNLKHSHWGELYGYNTTLGTYAPWPVSSYFYWKEKGLHLVGLADGSIQVLDLASTTIAGQIIKGESIQGFEARGLDSRQKQTDVLAVPVRRGDAAFGALAPSVLLSFRDGTGAYSQPIPISLGTAMDKRPVVKKHLASPLYFRRQWRLEVANLANLSLGPVEEVYTIMGD